MYKFIIACALVQVVLGNAIQRELKVCHRSDPNLDSCILENANYFVKNHKFEELGLEPIDPLRVEFMTAEGDTEPLKIKMIMKNITLYGHENTIFNKIKFDPNSLNGEINYVVPKVRMTCVYYATGRLFVLPLESSAYFDGNFTNMEVTLTFRLKTVERKTKNYFTVEKMAVKMHLDSGHVKLDSIDPNQQPQVSVIQDFFNANDRLVMDTVNSLVVENSSDFYKHIIERYIRKLPSDILLPN